MAINEDERKMTSKAQSTQEEPNLNNVVSSSRSINMEDGEEEKDKGMIMDVESATLTYCREKQNPKSDASSSSLSRGKRPIMEDDEEEEKRRILMIVRSLGKHEKKQNVPDGSSPSCSKTRRCVVPNEPPVQREAPVRETPKMVVNLMRVAKGRNPKLIIERKDGLTQTDVDSGQARLSIPKRQVIDKDFLNEEELNIVGTDQGLNVILVDPMGQEWTLKLREWNMGKCRIYAFINGWKEVVATNSYKQGYKMQLWSFHSPDMLYFVIVPTPLDLRQFLGYAPRQRRTPRIDLGIILPNNPPYQAPLQVQAADSSSVLAPVITVDSEERDPNLPKELDQERSLQLSDKEEDDDSPLA